MSESQLDERFEAEAQVDVTDFSPEVNSYLSIGDSSVAVDEYLDLSYGSRGPSACVAICSDPSIFDIDNFWLFDSGCPNDMVSVSKVTQSHKRYVTGIKSRSFNAACGGFRADKCLPLSFMMGGADFNAQPYMMTSTPSVLSMGKRVMEENFHLYG